MIAFIMVDLSLCLSCVDFEVLAQVRSDHMLIRPKIDLNLEKKG